MQVTNTERGYGWVAIALHWIAVVAIVIMFITGFRADMASEAGDREARAMLMGWHISVGASVALILLARVASSYLQPRPTPIAQPKLFQTLATLTHQLLLLAIVIQVISGPLAIWSGGRAINVFDALAIPSPFAERNEGVHEFAELLHAIGRWAIIVLGALHIAGAIKHTIENRAYLGRILSPPKKA